jgi:acetolactate synthase regulatory subunit
MIEFSFLQMEKLRDCSKMCEETSLAMKGLLKTVSQQKWLKNWNVNLTVCSDRREMWWAVEAMHLLDTLC